MGELGHLFRQGWWSLIMRCHSPVKPTAVKKTTRSLLPDVIFLFSAPWTKFIHLVYRKFRKCFVVSNGQDGNWNPEDYITIFWRGSGLVQGGGTSVSTTSPWTNPQGYSWGTLGRRIVPIVWGSARLGVEGRHAASSRQACGCLQWPWRCCEGVRLSRWIEDP